MTETIVLNNGVTVLLDRAPFYRSCSVGVFVESGAVHERPEECGISHFIEHMVFKGTKTRGARELAQEFEMIGGQANAFTAKEETAFFVKTLDIHAKKAVELLSDMVCNPAFDPAAVEVERGVIAEEISMYKDSPEDLAADRLFAKIWRGHALGREILGSVGTLSRITPEKLKKYHAEHYVGSNMYVSVAGGFDREETLGAIERRFSGVKKGEKQNGAAAASFYSGVTLAKKEIEQNHLCIGFESFSQNDPRRYALTVLSNCLGAGMNSRLFMQLREKAGLVYSVYSFVTPHKQGGMFGIYLAHSRENEKKAVGELFAQLCKIREQGISEKEFVIAKESYKTNVYMSFESSYSRMAHMAQSMIRKGFVSDPEEIIGAVEKLTLDDISAVANTVLNFEKMAVSAVGKPFSREFYQGLAQRYAKK